MAYASPPPSSFGQQGFGEPRRRRGAETPLGDGLASPRHVPRATRSPGPPTASLLDEQMPRQPPDLFSPPRQQHASPMACEPDDAPLFSRAEPVGNGFTDDGALDCWVLVFGLGPDDAPHALTALAQHGDVLEHERGAGNWLFARFSSRWQCEALLARKALVLGDGRTVVGALRVDDDAARRFGPRRRRRAGAGGAVPNTGQPHAPPAPAAPGDGAAELLREARGRRLLLVTTSSYSTRRGPLYKTRRRPPS